MYTCSTCNKDFQSSWHLKRHINNKKRCLPQEVVPKTESYKCLYCAKPFSNKSSLDRHAKSCFNKDDNVRQREIKLGVQLMQYYDKECRFCNKHFSSRWYLRKHYESCVERNKYIEKLQDLRIGHRGDAQVNIVNDNSNNTNTNCHNNNTFNIVINSYDETERIMRDLPKLVCNWMIQDQINYGSDDLKWTTGRNMITRTHTHPSNKNIKVSNERSKTLEVFDGSVYQRRVADEVIEECLQYCRKDIEHILRNNTNVVSRSMLLSAMEKYVDTMTSDDYKAKHKRHILNTLYSVN